MSDTTVLDPLPVTFADPALAELATERLEAEISTLAAHITAAMCRWLLLVAEYNRRRAYEQWECITMAQWLTVHIGISNSTARQHVAVADKLVELPQIRQAFSRGELSYSRVRAVCRVATADTEPLWLELARNATGSQIERIVSDTIRVNNTLEPDIAERQADARKLNWWIDDNGMYHVTGVLSPDQGALLTKLVKTHTDTSRDNRDPYEQRHADALSQVLARASLGDDGCPDCDIPATPPVLIVIHRYPDGTNRIENGPPIPTELADELASDADHITATHTTDSIRYSRKRKHRRAPTKTMRRYLKHRDQCCRFHGCGQTKNLHAHHVVAYRDNGDTVVINLVMLCPRHHGAIHDRGWTMSGNPDTGEITFYNPNGQPFTPPGNIRGNPEQILNDNSSLNIAPDTITPRGHGETYDHHLTIWITTNAFTPEATTPYRNHQPLPGPIPRKQTNWWDPHNRSADGASTRHTGGRV